MNDNVKTVHEKYQEMLPRWQLMDDVCDGSTAVEAADYLPKICFSDDEHENMLENRNYKKRAVFFDYTKDALNEMTGVAFQKDPVFDADGLDFLSSDADGSGRSLFQVSQLALTGLLRHARCGLFVDYPITDGNVSKLDIERKGLRPTIVYYKAKNIINWRIKKVGSTYKTELVVLKESDTIVDPLNEFQLKTIDVYRVLRLDRDGYYTIEVYRPDSNGQLASGGPMHPTNKSGSKWTEIPFIPLGSFANDWSMDSIPLESMAIMNIKHYINSADYEDSVHTTGQIQPVITGASDGFEGEDKDKKPVKLGSKNALDLPTGAKFEYVQAKMEMVVKEARDDKVKYMQALGARAITEHNLVKTATQSNNEALAKYSVLSLCVANVNEAMITALKWCYDYSGMGAGATFIINQEFAGAKLTVEEMKIYQNMVVEGVLSKRSFFEVIKSGKMPETTYEQEQQQIKVESAENI